MRYTLAGVLTIIISIIGIALSIYFKSFGTNFCLYVLIPSIIMLLIGVIEIIIGIANSHKNSKTSQQNISTNIDSSQNNLPKCTDTISFEKEAISIYKQVLSAYEKIINTFEFKIFQINEKETVYLVEDSLVVYIALKLNHPEYSKNKITDDYNCFQEIDMIYHIDLEELTCNELFKFVGSKFKEQFNLNAYYFFKIKKFVGWNNPYGKGLDGSAAEYVNRVLPELHLKERYDNWKGYLYHFIIYEVSDYENNHAFCICNTTNSNPNKIAFTKIKDLKQIMTIWRGDFNYHNPKDKTIYHYYGINFNDELRKVAQSLLLSPNFKKNNFEIYGQISFCIANGYIKDESEIENVSNELFKFATQGKLDELEKFIYLKTPTKWKSEFLVKEICENLYGKNNVIYQHRPYFLNTGKGQLSYDIYLTKKKIAIEYQGKQHFEPVEYFGGEISFQKQQERDLLKKQLSEQNNIKLIYINYNDPLTNEFISSKVKEVLEN